MKKEKIWVECINNTTPIKALEFLTKGKQYLATIEDEFTYTLENDKGVNDWFSKARFRIISDTAELWVECLVAEGIYTKEELTKGKIYKIVDATDKHVFSLQNNQGGILYYARSKFKIVDKTSISSTILTNMRDNLKKIVGNFVINVGFFNKDNTCDKIEMIIEDNTSGIVTDVYTLSTIFNDKLLDKANLILKEYNLKLELEQPKFKINCDKLYTIEEADILKEIGIDLVEVSK